MKESEKFHIRCRAVILHEGKLLVVRHAPSGTFLALPGGHIEYGENPLSCIEREIIEELGIKPRIGRLLYINTFTNDTGHTTEFFFEVLNSSDYADTSKLSGSHSHELAELYWTAPDAELQILPSQIESDFASGELLSDITRYIVE